MITVKTLRTAKLDVLSHVGEGVKSSDVSKNCRAFKENEDTTTLMAMGTNRPATKRHVTKCLDTKSSGYTIAE